MSSLRMPAVGVALPMLDEIDRHGVPDIAAAARHAEQLGFDSVRVADLVLGDGSPALDTTVTAAVAAAATSTVRVLFGVRVALSQPAVQLASQIATLQHLSANRVVLGLGAGGMPRAPYWKALGESGEHRGGRLESVLRVLPGLVAGESTPCADVPDSPRVRLAPGAEVPPILVGGGSAAAVRRAATLADGWLPSTLTAEELADGVRSLRRQAAGAGRPDPSVVVAGGCVPGDDAAARGTREAFVRRLAEGYGRPPEVAARIPLSGTARQIAEGLADYARAGADEISVAVVTDGDWFAAAEAVAEARSLLAGALLPT
ncbi:LLM class flavin-dependent oxidoreductase [Streptomyces sp. NPDC008150]|uniref:LLM class flavin-dependent oxidoreductase n=1 Tax=Streptomyces sp. NPDC008150 TaxID=3364816 RepID=UPI0036E8E700